MTQAYIGGPSPGNAALERAVLLANFNAHSVNRRTLSRAVGLLGLPDRAVREIGRDGTARTLTADAVRSGARYLLAAGGDGTLHKIVQVLAGTQTVLGILPLGTSNDLAGRLAIPCALNEALRTLTASYPTAIDLLNVGGERVTTVAGFGLAAHIARDANNVRAVPALRPLVAVLGGTIYPLAAATRITRHRARSVWYSLRRNDDPLVAIRATAILVGIVQRFGGGLSLTPDCPMTPGSFNALAITATTRAGLLRTLFRMKTGRSMSGLAAWHAGLHRLVIQTNGLMGAFGDGEWLGLRHRSVIAVERAALRVLVPPHSQSLVQHAGRYEEAV
jgi:diacylglycerol kinase family enzyme